MDENDESLIKRRKSVDIGLCILCQEEDTKKKVSSYSFFFILFCTMACKLYDCSAV